MGNIVKGIGKALGFSAPEQPDYSKAIKAAQFRPYSITTGFGASTFDPKRGTGTYTLDPRLAEFRDLLYSGAMEAIPSTEQQAFANQLRQEGMGLFSQAAGLNTDQMAQDYLQRQLDILAPSRAQEESRLADTLFKTGRTGAAIGMEGGYVNPEQFALLKAREGQNAQLGLEALDRARGIQAQDIQRALGYYGLAGQLEAQPYEQAAGLFGLGTNLEKLGMTPLTLGLEAGGQAANAGRATSQLLGMQEDTRVRYANDPGFFGSLIQGGIQSFVNPMSNFGGFTNPFISTSTSVVRPSSTYGGNAAPGIDLFRYQR